MPINWSALQAGLEEAFRQDDWAAAAAQVVASLQQMVGEARVTFAPGTITGSAPPPSYTFVGAGGTGGTIE